MSDSSVILNKGGKPLLGFTVQWDAKKRQWNGSPPEPEYLDKHHVMVIGLTNIAGKSTLIHGFASRMQGKKIIAFKTKRNEDAFGGERLIKPYLRKRDHWDFEYIMSVLAAMGKEDGWVKDPVIDVSRQAPKTFQEVLALARKFEAEEKNGMKQSQYKRLVQYLEMVEEHLKNIEFSDTLDLQEGINVIDISGLKPEVRGMVIRSIGEEIDAGLSGTRLIIPEAWEIIPKSNAPAKPIIEKLVREGISSDNIVIVDAQDIISIDSQIRKQLHIKILGIQSDANELENVLAELRLPKDRMPTREMLDNLQIGQFIVMQINRTSVVYAMPKWMDAETAMECAKNPAKAMAIKEEREKLKAEGKLVEQSAPTAQSRHPEIDMAAQKLMAAQLERKDDAIKALTERVTDLSEKLQQKNTENEGLKLQQEGLVSTVNKQQEEIARLMVTAEAANHAIAIVRTLKELVNGLVDHPEQTLPAPAAAKNESTQELSVESEIISTTVTERVTEQVGEIDDSEMEGQLLRMIAMGKFEEPKTMKEILLLINAEYGGDKNITRFTDKMSPIIEKYSVRPRRYLSSTENGWQVTEEGKLYCKLAKKAKV